MAPSGVWRAGESRKKVRYAMASSSPVGRKTIRLDVVLTPELHRELKRIAARDERPLRYIAHKAVERYVTERKRER
jgi:hypothetical protein